jgi:hypothetical protein
VWLSHPVSGAVPEPKVSELAVTRLSPTPCGIAVVAPGPS